MFRLLAAIAIFWAALTAGHPAAAQETDPEKLALARQVLAASLTGRPFDELLPDIADRAKTTFIRANPQMQLGIIEVVDKVALEMVNRREELDSGFAEVWAVAFEKEELEQLLAFYESPVGKKLAFAFPRIVTAQARIAEEWSHGISEDLFNRVKAELERMAAGEAKELETAPDGGNQATDGLKLQPQ